jgi:hypothetical protein
MENAKHIGCMWGLAVALGVGMAVANAQAVASAAPPSDSGGKGSSSGDSSSSGSPGRSGSTSATSSQRHGLPGSSTPTSSAGQTGKRTKPETPGTAFGQRGGATSSTVVDKPAADTTVRDSTTSSVESATQSAASAPAIPVTPAIEPRTPAATVITPTVADPVSRAVSTLINAVASPFSSGAPSTPVEPPAAFTLLAFARREIGSMSDGTSAVVDSDFISSPHNFGLFSVTSAADPDDNHYVAFVLATPLFTNILTSGTDPEDNLGFGPASIGVAGQTVNTFMSRFLNFSIALPIEDPLAPLFTELVRLGF